MSLKHLAETTNMIDTGKGHGSKVYRTPLFSCNTRSDALLRGVIDTVFSAGHLVVYPMASMSTFKISDQKEQLIFLFPTMHPTQLTLSCNLAAWAFRPEARRAGYPTSDLCFEFTDMNVQVPPFPWTESTPHSLHFGVEITDLILKLSNFRGVWLKAEFPVRGPLLQSSHLRLQTLAREAPKP